MADYAYLEGGPCDGTRHILNPARYGEGQVICKHSLYRIESPTKLHDGEPIYKYAGAVPTPKTTVTAAGAHGGWSALRRTFNHVMPTTLHEAHKLTKAGSRSLARAGKVRL